MTMKLITKSGSVYEAMFHRTPKGTEALYVRKEGWRAFELCMALFPDRVPFFRSAVKFIRTDEGKVECLNSNGVRTALLIPNTVSKGMVLAGPGPRGFQSTEIVDIVRD